MKHLLLMRHAKSSRDEPELEDFERPLAPRGIEAALLMGPAVAYRNWLPQKALVSPAARTRETWRLATAEWPHRPEAEFTEALYEADADAVLAEIRRTEESIGSLLVLGHNPGLEDLARRLGGKKSADEPSRSLRAKFPTGALARFELDGAWADLGFGRAMLTHFLRPKDLG